MMPLLLYPLLSMTLQRFLLSAPQADGAAVYRIAVASEREGRFLRALIDDPRSQPPPEIQQASDSQLARFEIVFHEQFSPEQTLRARLVDVAALIQAGDPPSVELLADSSQAGSLAARRILVERIQWLKLAQAQSALEALRRSCPRGPQQ